MLGNRTTEQWIAQYATSHQHPVNRACHTLGIPLILLSLGIFAASIFFHRLWPYALAVFVFGWLFQFVGHAFEHKAPEFLHDWRFLFVGNLVGGHDADPNGGEDIEGRIQADYSVLPRPNLGVETRARTGRDPANFPAFGSAWDVIGGPHAVVKLGLLKIQALVGYGGGRGPNAQLFGLGRASPFGMLNLVADIH